MVKTYLAVYLPETRTLLGVRGPWTQEFGWRFGPSWRWQPSPIITLMGARSMPPIASVGSARRWIFPATRATISRPTGCSTSIPRFGPPPGRKGPLEMVAVDGRSLDGLIFAATVLLGLLLLPARLGARTFVVGAAVIALVLAGVFAPTFSRQILGGVLASAVFVVAVMWTMGMAARRRKRPAAQRRPKRPPAASTASISRSISRSRLCPSLSPLRRPFRKEGRTMRKRHFQLQSADCMASQRASAFHSHSAACSINAAIPFG